MAQATLAMPNALSASRARPARRFGAAMIELRKLFRGMFDTYHPELHYMRGPGPKWREKHGNAQPPR